MTEQQWLERFAEGLGIEPPSAEEREALLALAGLAAHSSERTAAPISCWLAAKAGVSAERAKDLAGSLANQD